MNVGQITINSGQIGAIRISRIPVSSGPLVSNGTGAIDRIALQSIVPGGSITTGGDVNTLDILNNADLSGPGTGVFIGRDLNLLNIGGTLTLDNGAVFSISRNIGLLSQPPKGTGTGSNVLTLNFNSLENTTITVSLPPSVGSFIQGNVIIDTANNSAFLIGNNIYNTVYIEGGIIGFSGFLIHTASTPTNPPFESALPPTTSTTGSWTALQGAAEAADTRKRRIGGRASLGFGRCTAETTRHAFRRPGRAASRFIPNHRRLSSEPRDSQIRSRSPSLD